MCARRKAHPFDTSAFGRSLAFAQKTEQEMVRIRSPRSPLSSSSRRSGNNNDIRRSCFRFMIRSVIMLWFAGLTTCIYFMILQVQSSYTNESSVSSSSYYSASSLIRGGGGGGGLTVPLEDSSASSTASESSWKQQNSNIQNQHNVIMQERLKQQYSIKNTQNWMQRAFLKQSANSKQQEQQQEQQQDASSSSSLGGVGGSISNLPNWLLHGRQDVAARKRVSHSSDEGSDPSSIGKYDEYHVSKQYGEEHPECIVINSSYLQPKHGCRINVDTLMIHCHFENFRVDTDKINIKAKGGEPLESVMGREEQDEYPTYELGAFTTQTKPLEKPKVNQQMNDRQGLHYLEPLLMALQYPTKKNPNISYDCVESYSGTTLFVTRYEYANLYHTMTDWWNTYFSSNSILNNNDEQLRIVFLDGHAQGKLDPIWNDLFGAGDNHNNNSVQYISQLPKGGVCYENAILIPPGYSSMLFPQYFKPRCPIPSMANEFVSHILRRYNLENVKKEIGNIIIIDRQPYVAHPRSDPNSPQLQRVLDNMKQIKNQLVRKRNIPNIKSIEVIQLEKLSFAEQIQKIRKAHILIGNHGAGLTHIMFLSKHTHVIELTKDPYTLDFFEYISEWRSPHIDHTYITIDDSYGEDDTTSNQKLSQATIDKVITQVESIMLLPHQ